MQLQMVDLLGQYETIKNEIDQAIESVIEQSAFIKGPFVAEFENQLADYLEVEHAIGVGNGTDALQIAMMALEIGPGDEVIAPSFTFVATTEAAALLGAKPVFADIDPDTFNIDPADIERLITPRTKALVPVHLFGQPADMDPILEVAEKSGLPVIEDNAQSVGARYRDRRAGTMGAVATLSFFPSKNLGAFGDGGAVLTNDHRLADRIRLIANHGSRKKYFNERVGINSRLDGLQAAVLSVKLKHLDAFIERRIEAADLYDEAFASCPFVIPPPRAADRTHVFHQYTVRIRHENEAARDLLSAYLKERNVPHAVYYPVPVHLLPVNRSLDGSAAALDLKQTDTACREVLSLPMHTELTRQQISFISENVERFLETLEASHKEPVEG